jgi:hypothetical protein
VHKKPNSVFCTAEVVSAARSAAPPPPPSDITLQCHESYIQQKKFVLRQLITAVQYCDEQAAQLLRLINSSSFPRSGWRALQLTWRHQTFHWPQIQRYWMNPACLGQPW